MYKILIPPGSPGGPALSTDGAAFCTEAPVARTTAFVDGFNVYHALVAPNASGQRPFAKYKWLDYRKLAECYVRRGDALEAVYYFTAYAPWKSPSGQAKRERHHNLVAAQRACGVRVVLGRFRPVEKVCLARCRQTYSTYEEKRTDVNIAVTMVKLALLGSYEKAILISADSDLVPALEAIRSVKPAIWMMVVAPVGRTAKALFNAAHYREHMKLSHLKRSLLPARVEVAGRPVIECPAEWR